MKPHVGSKVNLLSSYLPVVKLISNYKSLTMIGLSRLLPTSNDDINAFLELKPISTGIFAGYQNSTLSLNTCVKTSNKIQVIKANNMRNSKTYCEFLFDTFLVWRVLLFHCINLYSIDIICQKLMQLSRVWGWTFPYASIWNWRYSFKFLRRTSSEWKYDKRGIFDELPAVSLEMW